MVDVRIALQREQFRDPHGAGTAAAAQIVAQQVDDHQVFRAVLLAGQQLIRMAGVFLRGAATRTGALDRAGFHLATVQLDEAFRREAENRAFGQLQVAGERRRTGLAQCLVGQPRRTAAGRVEALGVVHLVAVAGENVGLHALQGLLVLLSRQVGGEGRLQAECREIGRDGFGAEQLDQALAFVLFQPWVEHQMAGTQVVVADQRP
ncbi:hypothetical protein D3C81_1285160 [compost metagenome]